MHRFIFGLLIAGALLSGSMVGCTVRVDEPSEPARVDVDVDRPPKVDVDVDVKKSP